LRSYRDLFHIPKSPAHSDHRESIYLCGNSLGLMPRETRAAVDQELDDWATLGVEGHFHAKHPWLPYHEFLRDSAASLVGALPREVVVMNSLTVNLHLMMLSFYRPTWERSRILIDEPCFPSDIYAVKSQIRLHGFDPAATLRWMKPRTGEHTIRTEDVLETIRRDGQSIALILLAGVNFVTGQAMDIPRITKAAREAGCVVGWDLAHAAGNVELKLHDWAPDFAAWCSYKYLNSGPGAVAGAFVHERHFDRPDYDAMPRLEGWWGNDPATRFKMGPEFTPVKSADAWQLSNPPIFSLTPVKVSLDLFRRAGMSNLRAKSIKLTAYLESLIDSIASDPAAQKSKHRLSIITPRDPASRGCQLSLMIEDPAGAREFHTRLAEAGVICDFREPNVIRVAPVPLYNSFHDCWRFAEVLRSLIDQS
ncbi:MAG TPA: kynureninase, partial [Phycisphaerales bacterium]|nr:kynureninase [Phycisphaerales bacterium]